MPYDCDAFHLKSEDRDKLYLFSTLPINLPRIKLKDFFSHISNEQAMIKRASGNRMNCRINKVCDQSIKYGKIIFHKYILDLLK